MLFNLSAFPFGASSVLDRISEGQSGIYAWFRSYAFSESSDVFFEELMSAIDAPKFQARSGDITPYYGITLESKSRISPGKRDGLKQALKERHFNEALRTAFQWSILFQAPLYIGKSSNLKSRIEQHLRGGSILRKRLGAVSIDIEKTHLLIIPVDEIKNHHSEDWNQELPDEVMSQHEELFEEVFSRLFNPSFTVRLG